MSVGNFEKSVARGERYPLTVQFLTVSDSYVSFGHVAIDTLRFIKLRTGLFGKFITFVSQPLIRYKRME